MHVENLTIVMTLYKSMSFPNGYKLMNTREMSINQLLFQQINTNILIIKFI